MRLVDGVMAWLERHLPGAARPAAIEAREERTEDVRQRSIAARQDAERATGWQLRRDYQAQDQRLAGRR